MPRGLGRLEPTDFQHVEKYPLTAVAQPANPTAVVLGINWYSGFDFPRKDSLGRYWLPETNLGSVEGGHAICVKPGVLTDPLAWWDFYDQGNEGSCVGFACSRLSSLHNRTRYGGRWLYQEAQKIDEWPGEGYEGTSVRAGFEILRSVGHRRLIDGVLKEPLAGDGIATYRWAQSVNEVHQTIKMPLADSLGAVPLLNSWGRYYPHIVWLPDRTLERLLDEYGEAGLVTDR
jgi:hypothetical protein